MQWPGELTNLGVTRNPKHTRYWDPTLRDPVGMAKLYTYIAAKQWSCKRIPLNRGWMIEGQNNDARLRPRHRTSTYHYPLPSQYLPLKQRP